MADIIKTVGAGHGTPDYATLALWEVGEASADPGVGFFSIADCSGDCGTLVTVNGTFVRGYKILGDVIYDGTNESSLAFVSGFTLTTSSGTASDLKSNGVVSIFGQDTLVDRCRVISSASVTVNLSSVETNKKITRSVIEGTGSFPIAFGGSRPGIVRNCIVFGGTNSGIIATNADSSQDIINVFSFNNTTKDYNGIPSTFLTNASEDLTGSSGLTGFTSSELVDFASDDYRTKSTSTLATGGTSPEDFVGAFLEVSAGISVTVTGTGVPTQTEASVVLGGKTIILTLTGDTFVTGTSSEDGIAAGSDSDIAASGTNWDSLIKSALDNTDVALSVGDTVATITLPAFATYDIPATETITWTIPAASLTIGTSPVVATPTFTVTAAGGTISPYFYTNLLAS